MKWFVLFIMLAVSSCDVVYAAEVQPALKEMFGNEGGYTVDNGGPTNFGISQKAYPNLTTDHIKNMKIEEAAIIYERDYWKSLQLDKEPSQIIANEIFDSAVNEGVGTAARRIQQAVNLSNYPAKDIPIDGVLGTGTWAAKSKVSAVEFYVCWIGLRFERYKSLATKNPEKYDQYFKGWVMRVKNNVVKAVHEMDAAKHMKLAEGLAK